MVDGGYVSCHDECSRRNTEFRWLISMIGQQFSTWTDSCGRSDRCCPVDGIRPICIMGTYCLVTGLSRVTNIFFFIIFCQFWDRSRLLSGIVMVYNHNTLYLLSLSTTPITATTVATATTTTTTTISTTTTTTVESCHFLLRFSFAYSHRKCAPAKTNRRRKRRRRSRLWRRLRRSKRKKKRKVERNK